MKKFSLFLGMLLMVLSIGLYGCTIGSANTAYAADAYVVLDINPSVEILADGKGLVIQVNPLNEDAETLLVDTDFVGKTVDETVEAIVALALELGYLDFDVENAIVITAACSNDENTKKLEAKIHNRIRGYADKKGMSMEVIHARQEADEEMLALAESLEISIGKLKLIQLAMQFDETLTLELGATMAVKDLNAIVKANRQEMKEFVGEQLRNRFMEFHQEARGTFGVKRVQFIYDAMVLAEADFFAPVLTESTATAADLIALYEEYLNALKAIETPKPTEEVIIEAEATLEIALDEDLANLLKQNQTLMQEMLQIKAQLGKAKKGSDQSAQLRAQLQAKWKEIQANNEQIQACKEQYRVEFKGNHKGYEFGIHAGKGEFVVAARFDWINAFRTIRIEYEAKFAEIKVSLTDLEALFEEIVEPQLATVRAECQADFGALKAEVKGQADAIREQFRENKGNKHGMWGK